MISLMMINDLEEFFSKTVKRSELGCDYIHVDYQPGNSTRYDILVTRVDSWHEDQTPTYVVSLLNFRTCVELYSLDAETLDGRYIVDKLKLSTGDEIPITEMLIAVGKIYKTIRL